MRISQGFTQESTPERLDEVLQTIETECEEGGYHLALHPHTILSCVLTYMHIMRIQSDAGDLHPNLVFKSMDDDTLNSIKRLKDFYQK